MKVLLIGKFPPCQGGIATKTFWLCRALASYDFSFDIVTIVPKLYRSETMGEVPNTVRLNQITVDEEPPWFIPGSDLWIERLVSAALEFADEQHPDLVEANYLVPYGYAAFIVSRILGVPLIIRHAGSDLVKLYRWKPAKLALESLLVSADFVVTTTDMANQLPRANSSRRSPVCLPRYVPDPQMFSSSDKMFSGNSLLLAGKINYHWKLKTLDTLLEALKIRQEWRLNMITDGTAQKDFNIVIKEQGVARRVSHQSFVHPNQMPAVIAGATAIWAVERKGEISDFSNIIFETLSVGRPCLVSKDIFSHADAAQLKESSLLLAVDPDDPLSVARALDKAASMDVAGYAVNLTEAYSSYIEATVLFYLKAAHRSGLGS